MVSNAKKAKIKCRTYPVEYIEFGFAPCPSNMQLSMYRVYHKDIHPPLQPNW